MLTQTDAPAPAAVPAPEPTAPAAAPAPAPATAPAPVPADAPVPAGAPAPAVRRSLQAPARARHVRPLPLHPAESAAAWFTPLLTFVGVGLLLAAVVSFAMARWPDEVAAEPVSPVAVPTEPPAQVPVRLDIPAIGVSIDVRPVGLNVKQELVPEFGESGWYTRSPAPGEAGHAVIAGHVDSRKGADVFYRLHDLKPGREVVVRQANGGILTFTVDSLEELPKEDLVDSDVWRPSDRPRLALITCGGTFDKKSRSYADNLVVYATLRHSAAPQAPAARFL